MMWSTTHALFCAVLFLCVRVFFFYRTIPPLKLIEAHKVYDFSLFLALFECVMNILAYIFNVLYTV